MDPQYEEYKKIKQEILELLEEKRNLDEKIALLEKASTFFNRRQNIPNLG